MSAYGLDILGYDDEVSSREILGALDILGRVSRKERRGERLSNRLDRRVARNPNAADGFLAQRVSRILGKPQQEELVVEGTPEIMRRYAMPLGRRSVLAGATDTLERNAQRVIRIERLVLSSAALADFDVTGIFIGVEQQNASIANMPAEAFRYDAIATSLRGNTLNPGMSASVGVLNNGEDEASISATFFGEAMQQ
jgi:hypothetical protein